MPADPRISKDEAVEALALVNDAEKALADLNLELHVRSGFAWGGFVSLWQAFAHSSVHKNIDTVFGEWSAVSVVLLLIGINSWIMLRFRHDLNPLAVRQNRSRSLWLATGISMLFPVALMSMALGWDRLPVGHHATPWFAAVAVQGGSLSFAIYYGRWQGVFASLCLATMFIIVARLPSIPDQFTAFTVIGLVQMLVGLSMAIQARRSP